MKIQRPVRPPAIFLAVGGQRDNVGDTLLRRVYLDELRKLGELHISLGNCPATYYAGLRFAESDVLYPNRAAWLKSAARLSKTRHALFGFHSGEMSLSWSLVRAYLKILPIVALIRFRGGAAVHLSVGIRDHRKFRLMIIRPTLRLCNMVTWRDGESAKWARIGRVAPDWAVGTSVPRVVPPADGRKFLVVALRHDKPAPNDAFVSSVREFSERHELEVVMAAQTERDLEVAELHASRFGAHVHRWSDSDLSTAEDELRALYSNSAFVVSNRLHGLILGLTEGALPVGFSTSSSEKLDRTLSAIDVSGVCIDQQDVTHAQAVSKMEEIASRREQILRAAAVASQSLADQSSELVALVEQFGRKSITTGIRARD